jgi:ElaB/YqjD/DUF883 family membrane-anchored ribosome-binding protein
VLKLPPRRPLGPILSRDNVQVDYTHGASIVGCGAHASHATPKHAGNLGSRTNAATYQELLQKFKDLMVTMQDSMLDGARLSKMTATTLRGKISHKKLRDRLVKMQTHVCETQRAVEAIRCEVSDGQAKPPDAVLAGVTRSFLGADKWSPSGRGRESTLTGSDDGSMEEASSASRRSRQCVEYLKRLDH